jgi:hypothetical protein
LEFKPFALAGPRSRAADFASREASMKVGKVEAAGVGKQPVLELDDWNKALYRHYFSVPRQGSAEPVVRLYVTGEELEEARGLGCSGDEARTAFIEAVKTAIAGRSLAADAVRRRRRWSPDSTAVPPFLSHLLLTCMAANDVAEDLRWTGNFRTRLCQILGTSSQPQLERLRDLWVELATWSVEQNRKAAGCRPLRLPPIPHSGHYSIIGYSLRLAIPTRRDQETLATVLKELRERGEEPGLRSVLRLVSPNIGRFTSEFQHVFDEFVTSSRKQPAATLFHTAFWSAVREAVLFGLEKPVGESMSEHVRLELEDDDGRFWLTLTCDSPISSVGLNSEPLPNPRSSPFRYRLLDAESASLVGVLLSSSKKASPLLSGIKTAVTEGILLFEEGDDYVFTLARQLPSSGAIRMLVCERLKEDVRRALLRPDLKPEITKSAYFGWSEWRGLNVEGLRQADLHRFPALAGVRSLRVTIPPPEIKLRGGIRIGGSFVALLTALPLVEIAGASRVELVGGEALKRLPDSDEIWSIPSTLAPSSLIGTRRIVASTGSGVLAEREIDFIATAFTTDYKQPLDPSRWLVESTRIDTVPLSDFPSCVIPSAGTSGTSSRRPLRVVSQAAVSPTQPHLIPLTTLLCARFAAQRGISEGELVSILTRELGVHTSEVWPILRGWVEGGMLDVLSDARWRGRIYFGRLPHLVIHRVGGDYEAVLVGLLPPFLQDRFRNLSVAEGLVATESRSVSEFVPALQRVRSKNLALLNELAIELELPLPACLRQVGELLRSVRTAAEEHSSTLQDHWPRYRQWDWQRRAYAENPRESAVRGISVEWCRRDDGPDRYKVYRDGELVWWTRSRTWAMLAAFAFADVPAFSRLSPTSIESRGDGLHLPLPLARIVACAGPANPGPTGQAIYRYTFRDRGVCDLVLSKLWPGTVAMTSEVAPTAKDLSTILQTGYGPAVPLPAALSRGLARLFAGRPGSRFVPSSSLPRLYSMLETMRKTGIQ